MGRGHDCGGNTFTLVSVIILPHGGGRYEVYELTFDRGVMGDRGTGSSVHTRGDVTATVTVYFCSRATVVVYFMKPTVVGRLTTLVVRVSWNWGGHVV